MDRTLVFADFLVSIVDKDIEGFSALYAEYLEGWRDEEENEDEEWLFGEVVGMLYQASQFGEIDEAFIGSACDILYVDQMKEVRDFYKQDILFPYWSEQGDKAKMTEFVNRAWTLPAELERVLNMRKLALYLQNRDIEGIRSVRDKVRG